MARDGRGRFLPERRPEPERPRCGMPAGAPELERHEAGCPRGDWIALQVSRGRRVTYMNVHAEANPACACDPLRHAWHRRPGIPYLCCERCGAVRPADGHADAGTCRGVVRVTVREPEPEAERPWPNERAR